MYFAIKSVDKCQKPRVLQEVRTLHTLDHANILKFYAWYETKNHMWLILEYCVGGDLMALLKQDLALPEASIHDFARDAVVALQYVHAHGVVHADFKPSNLLLDENGRIKLGGFGLSRRLADLGKGAPADMQPATPTYMAPELFQAGGVHSSASDLWALGCVLYECASGRPPFVSPSFKTLAHLVLTAEPSQLPPGTSLEFCDLVARLLDKDAGGRIGWAELPEHPFWQAPLPLRAMPPEPHLAAFIAAQRSANLGDAPAPTGSPAQQRAGEAADAREASEVGVQRLSVLAADNLEREGDAAADGWDGAGASPAGSARGGDVHLHTADAELDFQASAAEPELAEEREAERPASDRSSIAAPAGSGAANSVAAASASRAGTPGAAGQLPAGEAADNGGALSAGAWGGPGTGNVQTATDLLELMWHASDTVARPLVGNRAIERVGRPACDAASLPFPALDAGDIMAAPQDQLDAFLAQVHHALAAAGPLSEKVNVLAWLEGVCGDAEAAAVLLNSALGPLLVRLLASAPAPGLRARLASALGLLVRHTAFIGPELAASGVVSVLTGGLRDAADKVRRRVAATLGELLFYIAMQQLEAESVWDVGPATVAAVVRALRPDEDDIVQHYACHAIGNIAAQAPEWAARFATPAAAGALAALVAGAGPEAVRAEAASALGRLARHHPAVLAQIGERGAERALVGGLTAAGGRLRVPAATLLNLLLANTREASRVLLLLQEERSCVGGVLALLEAPQPAAVVKGLVALALLTRVCPRFLAQALRARLLPQLERLARERGAHVAAALAALRAEIAAAAAALTAQMAEEARGLLENPDTPCATLAALAALPLLPPLLSAPALRADVISAPLLASVGALLAASAAAADAMPEDAMAGVVAVVEALGEQVEAVLDRPEDERTGLLAALAGTVAAVGAPDARFACLKLLCDATLARLCCPGDAAGRAEGEALAAERLLPLVPGLLEQGDPMPLFTLKLTCAVLDAAPAAAVPVLQRLGLFERFFDFMSLDHANNNVHNMRLCRLALQHRALCPASVADRQAAAQMAAVLVYTAENMIESFLEPVLELLAALIEFDRDALAAGAPGSGETRALAPGLPVLVELVAHPEPGVACAAASALAALLALWPSDTAALLLAADNVPLLGSALGAEGVPANPDVQASLLAALALAARAADAPPLPPGELAALRAAVAGLARCAGAGLPIAQLFVVPTLAIFAWYQSVASDESVSCNGMSLDEALEATANALLASAPFQASGGRNHLIALDSWALNIMNLPPLFIKVIANMTIGQFEAGRLANRSRTLASLGGTGLKLRNKGVFFMGRMDDRQVLAERMQIGKRLVALKGLNMTYVYTSYRRTNTPQSECDTAACYDAPRCVDCYINFGNKALYQHRLERSEFSLMLPGDPPTSSRLHDTLAAGAIPIMVAGNGSTDLPFPDIVPWRQLVFTLPQDFTAAELRAVVGAPAAVKQAMRVLGGKHLADVSWTAVGNRVADNILAEAVRRCQ
ncbi:hypothetical protein WJX81_002504 [Elliptochloris bilobata]|uniref:Protein kinase domain-containing protein n=1 Tax=Elliptochloris bilobata TaxID=381761 RepID=A0AAW1RMQ2_9CHLO